MKNMKNTKKQAYLIMAHEHFDLLEKLLLLLEHPMHDFYIHVDKKSDFREQERFKDLLTESTVTFVKPISVLWGDYSQIDCEMRLIKAAAQHNYAYYHLISGVDLPLKRASYIYEFFSKQEDVEFVDFISREFPQSLEERFQYYHLFKNVRNPKPFKNRLIQKSKQIQKQLNINRVKNKDIKFGKGANWFSITNSFAQYIVSHEGFVRSTFGHTICCDEIFLQTLVLNSEYVNHLPDKAFADNSECIMRKIDWTRGAPYTYRKEDFEELISTKCLFARKFNPVEDSEIIDMLYRHLTEKE